MAPMSAGEFNISTTQSAERRAPPAGTRARAPASSQRRGKGDLFQAGLTTTKLPSSSRKNLPSSERGIEPEATPEYIYHFCIVF